MKNTRYVEAKVDYFNITKGDLCQVIWEDGEIFVKVVKVGMTQVHYMYNFEIQDVKVTKEQIWKSTIEPIVLFLAASPSVSSGRSYNDILLMIDGGDMPRPSTMNNRGDMAPTIFMNELFKLLEDTKVEFKDDLIDSLLCGEMDKYARDLFIHMFYVLNYRTLESMAANWIHYKDVVTTAHKLTQEG